VLSQRKRKKKERGVVMTIADDLMKTAPFEMGFGVGGVVIGISCLCSLWLILSAMSIDTEQSLAVTRVLMEHKVFIVSLIYGFCFMIFLGWGGLMAAIIKTIKNTNRSNNNDI